MIYNSRRQNTIPNGSSTWQSTTPTSTSSKDINIDRHHSLITSSEHVCRQMQIINRTDPIDVGGKQSLLDQKMTSCPLTIQLLSPRLQVFQQKHGFKLVSNLQLLAHQGVWNITATHGVRCRSTAINFSAAKAHCAELGSVAA